MQSLTASQEHADKIVNLVEIIFMGLNDMPCFQLGEDLIAALKDRVLPVNGRDTNAKRNGGALLMNEI